MVWPRRLLLGITDRSSRINNMLYIYHKILLFNSFDDTNPKSQDEINPSYITPVNPAVTETTYEDDTHVPTTCCPLTYCCIVPSADSVKSASSSASSLSPNYATCIRCRSKSHPNLTILVVFLAVMIDVMLMTVIGEDAFYYLYVV